jgi:hypothetical protein
MFVTNESALEVVEHAYSRGAHGYVYKPCAQRDVLPVLEAIIRGARFVSAGLERMARGDSVTSHRHDVLFCSSDEVLVEGFSRFIARGLDEGNTVIAVMSDAHDRRVRGSLQAAAVDVALAIRRRRYIPVNATELFMTSIVNGRPDPARFFDAVGEVVLHAEGHAAGRQARIAVCGEGTSIFWTQGHVEEAIYLEHVWDEIAKSRPTDLLCAFPRAAREQSVHAVRRLCAEHTAVEIS